MKEKDKEEQNEYAETIDGKSIYILDAESGRKGYYCIGCKVEMQAVKSKIKGRKSYFRHDATDVKKSERKCVFSNQNYRHSQAVFILNRIKKIKVPALYKYPPKNTNEKAIKIRDSEFIEASYTKSELTFYETDNGDVKYGKNPEIDSRNLLIRPDVTFFNSKNEPILFVEIVVTHKIDNEKLAKIKRLGIDTVQITIPKDSLENIEDSFSRGKRIKWIFNNEQERTDYIYTTENNTEGVSSIDELQRKFFEESFECRKSQIRNLIRGIKRSLESQQYRKIESDFRKEILRIENNTKGAKSRLEENRRRIRETVERRMEPRRIFLNAKREQLNRTGKILEENYRKRKRELECFFEQEEEAIRRKDRVLEERYLRRRNEIKREKKEVEERALEIERFESMEGEYRDQETGIEYDIQETKERIDEEIRDRRDIPEKFERFENKERERFKKEERRIKEERNSLPRNFEEKRRELEREFESIRKRRIEQIENKDIGEYSEFSGELKKILDTRSILVHWEEKQNNFSRYKKALEYFRKGAYKNWRDSD